MQMDTQLPEGQNNEGHGYQLPNRNAGEHGHGRRACGWPLFDPEIASKQGSTSVID